MTSNTDDKITAGVFVAGVVGAGVCFQVNLPLLGVPLAFLAGMLGLTSLRDEVRK